MNEVTEPSWHEDAPTQDPHAFEGDAWTVDNALDVEGAILGMDELKGVDAMQGMSDKASDIEDLSDWPKLYSLVDDIWHKGEDVMKAVEKFDSAHDKAHNDPIGWLGGTLVSFVIDMCQPLEDILAMVTGNEGRMKTSCEMWLNVAEGARQTRNYISQTGYTAMSGWNGDDADAARHRIVEISSSVATVGGMAAGVVIGLRALAMLVKKLQDNIKDFIGKIVMKALVKWLPVATAGLATFGSSTAAAVAMAVVTIANYIQIAINLVDVASNIFDMAGTMFELLQEANPELQKIENFFNW